VFAFQQASASSGFQFQVPANANDVDHQQASPFVFQASAISAAQHHQAPVIDVVNHHQAPDADDVEHHETLAEPAASNILLPSPARSPREDVPPAVEDGLAYVPLAEGQLDCTRCHTARELLHESGNYPSNVHTLMIYYSPSEIDVFPYSFNNLPRNYNTLQTCYPPLLWILSKMLTE
jgi:hypothetical protein